MEDHGLRYVLKITATKGSDPLPDLPDQRIAKTTRATATRKSVFD